MNNRYVIIRKGRTEINHPNYKVLQLLDMFSFLTDEEVQKNIVFTDYLQNGIPVKYLENGEEKTLECDGVFLAIGLEIPEIYSRSGAEAVLRSTPTLFTQSSTTPLNASPSFFWFISC